jgi:hypothetical protein
LPYSFVFTELLVMGSAVTGAGRGHPGAYDKVSVETKDKSYHRGENRSSAAYNVHLKPKPAIPVSSTPFVLHVP